MDKKDVQVELVTYAGKTYRRYPNSNNSSDQDYFRRSRSNNVPEYLHQRVYRDHYGEIQPGFHVHHVDGNPGNNQPENLVCISVGEHMRAHWTPERRANHVCSTPWTPERLAKNKEHCARIRPLTKAWHASEEGRAMHRQIGALGYKNFVPITKQCQHCGCDFQTRKSGHQDLFCSNACKSAWRRASGVDDETRVCVICGKDFVANKYTKIRTCSLSCRGYLIAANKRGGL